jgi:hypothetical protein
MVAPAAPVAEPLADGEGLPLVLPLAPTEPEVDGVDGMGEVVTLPLAPAPARDSLRQRSFSAPINVSHFALLEALPLVPALPLTPVEGLPLGCAAVPPDDDAPALPCPEVWA